jgi:serine/threonine protein kinase
MEGSRPDEAEVFNTARGIEDTEARRSYLREACGADPGLLARVEALLRVYDEETTGGLARHVGLEGRSTSPPTDAPRGEGAGSRVGHYTLLKPIGEGGMGMVYLAEQRQPVRRRVALKLIKRGMDSRDVLARFESERQALALMEHPHIARVFDAGTTDDGRPYFVMELVKGVPITEYCDSHRLDLPARLSLFRQVCSAVQHAHQKGIIHRDLKPSNILVEAHNDRPVPKVIDFGLAKATSGLPLTERTLMTAFGSVAGTPLYMAPEQASFNALDVDTRADIYALGVVLYELLTGTTPIARDSIRRAALDEMLRVIREVEPPTPSSRISTSESLPSVAATRGVEPARLSRLVRGELDWIVMKALAKERERRYASAIGLADDIERYLSHEPVSAGPPTATYRLRKFVRRNRARVTATALVLLALLLGVVGTTLGLFEARRQGRIADGQRRQAEKRLAQVTKMNDILGSIFQDLNPEAVRKDGKPLPAVLGERLDRASAEIEGEATGDPLAVARMQMTLGRSQLGLGNSDRAIGLFTKARATLAAGLGADHPDTLAVMNNLALSYAAAGRNDRALPLLEETVALRRAKLGADHTDTLVSMTNLANRYAAAGQLDRALKLREETLALRKAKFGTDHPDTIKGMNNLAISYNAAGRADRAIALHQEALALMKAKLGPDHPDTLKGMNSLAVSYAIAGQNDRAIALFEETLALRNAKLGSDHPDTLNSMSNLANGYDAAGRNDRALRLREEALALRKAKLGPDHPDTLAGMNNLAVSYKAVGRDDQALALLEEALALRRARLGAGHPDTLDTMSNLAASYGAAGQHDRALALLEEALPLMRAKLGPEHPATLTTLEYQVQCLANSGQLDRAGAVLDGVIASRRKAQGEGHPDASRARMLRAELDLAGGRLDAAEAADRAVLAECRTRLGADDRVTIAAGLALARVRTARGDRGGAEPLLRAALESARKNPTDRETLATALTESGRSRLSAGDPAGAEALLREALGVREAEAPRHWRTAEVRSLLGAALLARSKTAEAAPLLRSGYEGMARSAAAIPRADRPRLAEALDRLIAAGEAAGTEAELAAWKGERARLGGGGQKR